MERRAVPSFGGGRIARRRAPRFARSAQNPSPGCERVVSGESRLDAIQHKSPKQASCDNAYLFIYRHLPRRCVPRKSTRSHGCRKRHVCATLGVSARQGPGSHLSDRLSTECSGKAAAALAQRFRPISPHVPGTCTALPSGPPARAASAVVRAWHRPARRLLRRDPAGGRPQTQAARLPETTARPSTACAMETGHELLARGARHRRRVGVKISGQNSLVRLTSSNASYDAGTEIFSVDVTVQNLMNEAIGTPDGVTPDPEGIRVFFAEGPTSTSGPGEVTVENADGTTGSARPTSRTTVLRVLSKDEVSGSKTWRFAQARHGGPVHFSGVPGRRTVQYDSGDQRGAGEPGRHHHRRQRRVDRDLQRRARAPWTCRTW